MISAPILSETSCGATTLPMLLLILRPWPSTVKPCVSKPRYGARPYMAAAVSSEEWNQPRCWSWPSKYRSASGPSLCAYTYEPSAFLSPWLPFKTVVCVVPESNHTSRISVLLVYCSGCSAPTCAKRSAVVALLQASMPPFSTMLAARSTRAMVLGCSSPESMWVNSGSGTPHDRWREMHQSGRPAIMSRRRVLPFSG